MTPLSEQESAQEVIERAEKLAEERGREKAENAADHTEFRRHLKAINGSVARVESHMASAQTNVVVLKNGVIDLAKDVTAIVQSLENREAEARADRRSVKIALYSFATAVTASGFGVLLYHLIN